MAMNERPSYTALGGEGSAIAPPRRLDEEFEEGRCWCRRRNKKPKTASQIRRSFGLMALCFALNHGCVTALIALASSDLGQSLGNHSSGTLYLTYTLTAAFFATTLTSLIGAKQTLSLGLWIYCFYVGSYLVAAATTGAIRRCAVYAGAVMGGLAAGVLWPAQGKFYADSAARYAEAKGSNASEANSVLGGDFASLYLGCEVAMKLLSSALTHNVHDHSKKILYVVFTAVATASAAGISFVDDVETKRTEDDFSASDEEDNAEETPVRRPRRRRVKVDVGKTAFSAMSLLLREPRCLLMIPMNFAFGLGGAYLNGYFLSSVVSKGLGTSNVGYVSSLVVGTAALSSAPLGHLGARIGTQLPLVVAGAACFATFVLLNLLLEPSQLQTWTSVVPLVALFGLGRATWENNFKATFADYFPQDRTAAFANVQLQSGLASCAGFFLNSSNDVSPAFIGKFAFGFAILAIGTQIVAKYLDVRHRRLQSRQAARRLLIQSGHNPILLATPTNNTNDEQ